MVVPSKGSLSLNVNLRLLQWVARSPGLKDSLMAIGALLKILLSYIDILTTLMTGVNVLEYLSLIDLLLWEREKSQEFLSLKMTR